MSKDLTLLDSETPLTIENLKELFRQNDFTTFPTAHKTAPSDPTAEELSVYVKKHFRTAFEKTFSELCKKRLMNFSQNHPANILAKADENVVVDAAMQILDNPTALKNAKMLLIFTSLTATEHQLQNLLSKQPRQEIFFIFSKIFFVYGNNPPSFCRGICERA